MHKKGEFVYNKQGNLVGKVMYAYKKGGLTIMETSGIWRYLNEWEIEAELKAKPIGHPITNIFK